MTPIPLRCLLACMALLSSMPACTPGERPGRAAVPLDQGGDSLRIALFNIREMRAGKIAEVDAASAGSHPQLRAAAEIIQRVRPDVLVLQEVDLHYGAGAADLGRHARRFAEAYLGTGTSPIDYPHLFAGPSNTGLLTGIDLDRDGHVASDDDRGDRAHGNDSFGYGTYPGEYSMAVLSRLPLLAQEARTFQHFLWRDLPGNHIPPDVFSAEALEILRLSSKSHWDLPVAVGRHRLHLLVSHPTPPGFDGEEDRNGRRNFDEIKLWAEYLNGSDALIDDAGRRGARDPDEPFVIVGDLNARPDAAESIYDGQPAITQLLEHPRVRDTGPVATSRGALQGREAGPPDHPERATAVFGGGMRIDYVLPSEELEVANGGVFWPSVEEDAEGHALAEAASDHRLVWVDLRLPRD